LGVLKSWLQRWRNDVHLGRVFKNFGLLLGGRGVAGIVSLGTLALMGHGLTPEQFGTVVLVQTFAMTARGLVTIQPWAAVIHFGTPALQRGDEDEFKRLIAYTGLIDLVGGIAAALLGILFASTVAGLLDWDPEIVLLAQIYSSALVIAIEATPKGILRLFDRYDLLSLQGIIRPILRLVGVAIAFLNDSGVLGYLAAYYVTNLAHYFSLVLIARHEMRKRVTGSLYVGLHPDQVHRDCPALWRYMLTVYWQKLLDLVQRRVATLLAGVLFGAAAAGLYRVAWDLSNVLAKPVLMLRQSILPDLARLWHDHDQSFRRLTLRSGLIAGTASAAIFGLVVVVGRPLIELVMGPAYIDAAPLLVLLVLAGTIDLYGFALRPAGYAMGRPGVIVAINTVAMLIYGGLFFGLTSPFGLLAPGLASVAAALISLVSLTVAVLRLSRNTSMEART
jgi:O-antigen/teichoic acid export membrane protein